MLLSQGGDVGLVAVIVEPPVHHSALLTHLLLELVPGRLVGSTWTCFTTSTGYRGFLPHE
jgi:hypothetical protein